MTIWCCVLFVTWWLLLFISCYCLVVCGDLVAFGLWLVVTPFSVCCLVDCGLICGCLW